MDKYGPLTIEDLDRIARAEAREEYYKTHINPTPSIPGEQSGSGTFRGCFTKRKPKEESNSNYCGYIGTITSNTCN